MSKRLNRTISTMVAALALVGAAMAQGPQGGPGGPGHRRPMGGPAILMHPPVAEELRLTEAQIQQLREALPRPQPGQRISREEIERIEKIVQSILSPAQYKRYQEISLQMGGPGAILRPDVREKLALSEGQVEQIEDILEQNRPPMPPPPGSQGGPGMPPPPPHDPAKRKQVDDAIANVLSAEQKAKWKALLGEPFQPRRDR